MLDFCKEKDSEACAIKVHLPSYTFYISVIYRSPSGNFEYILNNLELMLNSIYSNSTDLIICGDFNIVYLNNYSQKIIKFSFSLLSA